jgi:hypothetical protein
LQQVPIKRRIIINDDDDWPQLSPVPAATNNDQCVAEGFVMPSAASKEAVKPEAVTTSAIPALSGSEKIFRGLPALLSDSEDSSDYSDADAPGDTAKTYPSARQRWALRVLGLIKEEDTPKSPNSYRALRTIQRLVATRAAVDDDTVATVELQHRGN